MNKKIFLIAIGLVALAFGISCILSEVKQKHIHNEVEKTIPVDVKVTTPAPQPLPNEPEEKWATVRISTPQGTWITKGEINFGVDVTTITLDNDKRVWIGSNFTAEEL